MALDGLQLKKVRKSKKKKQQEGNHEYPVNKDKLIPQALNHYPVPKLENRGPNSFLNITRCETSKSLGQLVHSSNVSALLEPPSLRFDF